MVPVCDLLVAQLLNLSSTYVLQTLLLGHIFDVVVTHIFQLLLERTLSASLLIDPGLDTAGEHVRHSLEGHIQVRPTVV